MTETSQLLNPFSFSTSPNSTLNTSNLTDLFNTKQKKADLGPIWTEDELQIFLKYFKQSGLKDLESMQSELQENGYKRTVNNLLGVYLKNRNFLNYNPACTAKDLYAIMADRYQNIEDSAGPAFPDGPPLRKLKSETCEMEVEDMGHTGISRDMESIEENMRLKDDGLMLKRKSTSVKRSGSAVDEVLFNPLYKTKRIHISNSVAIRERPRKVRKSTVMKGKFPVNYDLHDPQLFKNIEVGCRGCVGKSLKKTYQYFAANTINKELSMPFLKLVGSEMMYSPIDKPFFEFNELQGVLQTTSQEIKLTKDEWSVLRSCIGKPRRFSNRFINEQREKLYDYRRAVRNHLYDRAPLYESKLHPSIIQKVKAVEPLQVSQIVLAIHPTCQHIHPGSILTITGSSIIIKFFPTELGVISVPDSKVIPISQQEASEIVKHFGRTGGSLTPIAVNKSSNQFETEPSSLKKALEDLDFNSISMIIKMLEKKTALVSELRKYNNLAEMEPENLNEKLKQEYGWTGAQTKLLDKAIKNTLAKSRLRGIENYDAELIAENLDNLLQRPLRSMLESGNKKSEEKKDVNVIKEIKNLLNKNIEEKISGEIRNLTDKFREVHLNSHCEIRTKRSMDDSEDKADKEFEDKNRTLDISTCERSEDKDIHEIGEEHVKGGVVDDCSHDKKDKLKTLVNNMMGVLFSLKYQGDLHMAENKYLTELHTEIFEENAEEFHEINNVLLNICSR